MGAFSPDHQIIDNIAHPNLVTFISLYIYLERFGRILGKSIHQGLLQLFLK